MAKRRQEAGARQPAGDRGAAGHARPQRLLLKLSGELLGGSSGTGFDPEGLAALASQVAGARRAGAQVAVVIGGGNLVRGGAVRFLPRDRGDALGMLGTLMNALALEAELERGGIPATVLCAFDCPRFADLYRPERGRALLAAGEVVLLAGGTGQTRLTTDTAAALRAIELECTLLVKGTKVDGVYSADPKRDPRARRYARLTHAAVLERRLGVMDLTAITLAMECGLPIVVLNATRPGSVAAFLETGRGGTRIDSGARPRAARSPGR